MDNISRLIKVIHNDDVGAENSVNQRHGLTQSKRANSTTIVAGTAVVALALGTWLWPHQATPLSAISTQAPGEPHFLTVQPQAISRDLTVLGTIGAGRTIAVLAPFDGVVKERLVQLGDFVEAGTILLVVDTGDLTSKYREAQSAQIKAKVAADSLARWESSAEVLRTQRALDSGEVILANLEQQVVEIKALFDKGIVARNEYDGVVQQRDGQRGAVEGYRQDLATVLERGGLDGQKK